MKINLGLAALAAIALTSPVLAADVVRAPVRVPAAAAVASPLTGDVSFFAGFQEGPFSEHHGIFGGEGRFAWGLGSAMVLQGDAGGQSRVDSDGFGSSTFALTGHLYNRGMGGALGVKVDVDARNARAIRWLRWLGFRIHPAEAHGIQGLPFHRFEMRSPADV